MFLVLLRWTVIAGAGLSFLYYVVAILSARRFFAERESPKSAFTPPVSVLKPLRGLDPDAYANLSTFCRQDYPQYEVLFGVSDPNDPVIPVIQKLIENYPTRAVRLLVGSVPAGTNKKVAKLCRLAREARHEILVISDSDIRVAPDYLRRIAAPFHDPEVGAVTCLYRGIAQPNLGSELEATALSSHFLAGVLVARLLEGVRFALGATMATTRRQLEAIGGFEAIADHFGDDFELGKRIALKGRRVELLNYTVFTALPSETILEMAEHQLRWAVGLRHARPIAYLGLILTQALPWSLAAIALEPSVAAAAGFLGAYVALRLAMAWTVGVWGLEDPLLRKKWWLVPLWDAAAFLIWLFSFTRNRVNWRGDEFYVQKGRLIPASPR